MLISQKQQHLLLRANAERTLADMSEFDVVVVGGGAAGLSAALVLSRARRRVAVVDAGEPRNAPAAEMHGYLTRDGLPPHELIAVGRAEVTSYGGVIIETSVTKVALHETQFELSLADGRTLMARRLLVATGLRDEIPDIAGAGERWGRDLLHCPYCHGWEVRDRPLGVLGGTPGAVQHALLVSQWSRDVIFFTHSDTLTDDDREQLVSRRIDIVEGVVNRLVVVDDRLRGVGLSDGRIIEREAVFVRPRFVPNIDLLSDLACDVDHHGWVTPDTAGRTSVPGVWVAGNAVNPRAQVITAAGEGSAAAIAINADLVDEDVALAVADLRAAAHI
jgi:thioredoxin reductase